MNLNACTRSVNISLIDFTDFTYAISPSGDITGDEILRNSIRHCGILHPPIIMEKDRDFYAIVRGRKRLHTFRSLYPATDSCYCLVLPNEIPAIDIYSVMLEDLRISRTLSPVEKALLLRKISSIVDRDYIVAEFLPRMDIQADHFQMRQILMLLDLEEPVIHAVHAGFIPESVARSLSSLSAGDRMALYEIMTSLHLNTSYQKKLVLVCREIASREQKSIAELLGNREVSAILNHQEANPPQKTKNLMTWLSRRHMPRSSQAKAEFAHFVSALQLPDTATVDHTPSFEDDEVSLSLTFANRKSLQDTWDKIRNAFCEKDN